MNFFTKNFRQGAVLCVRKHGLSSMLQLRYLVVDNDVQCATSRVACIHSLYKVRSEERLQKPCG